jgi:cytochrome c-type biogenesis protein CcsB
MTDTSHITVLPLNISAFIYLASCVFFFVAVARAGAKTQSKASVIAEFLAVVGVVFHTVGLAGRWYVGGIDRPPWTNLYESLVGFAWMLAVFQVLAFRKNKVPLVGAFSMPLVFLLMGMSVMTPNKAVEPLVPALQSWWMKIHVPTNFIGYGAFSLAAMVAVAWLLAARGILTSRLPSLDVLEDLMYKSISVGFAFFTIATILGAMWAAEAWGGYWSWDPKETWALIVWLNYAAWLHLRLVKGLRGPILAWWAVIGLLVTTFAFLGVNMFLSGLHSYGEL